MSYGALKIHYDAHNGNKEVWEPIHRNHLIHLDDLEILKQYNSEIRGLYNYYKIANNVSVLNDFNYVTINEQIHNMHKNSSALFLC